MGKDYDSWEVNVEEVPKSNQAAELGGLELEATDQVDVLQINYTNKAVGAEYNIRLQEDGNIEIEAEEPALKYANTPHSYYTFSGHTSDIEKLVTEDSEQGWIPFNDYIDSREKLAEDTEKTEEELEQFLSQIQRIAVEWESQSGEKPSPYR